MVLGRRGLELILVSPGMFVTLHSTPGAKQWCLRPPYRRTLVGHMGPLWYKVELLHPKPYIH